LRIVTCAAGRFTVKELTGGRGRSGRLPGRTLLLVPAVYVKRDALEKSMANRRLTVELGNGHSDLNATGAGA